MINNRILQFFCRINLFKVIRLLFGKIFMTIVLLNKFVMKTQQKIYAIKLKYIV